MKHECLAIVALAMALNLVAAPAQRASAATTRHGAVHLKIRHVRLTAPRSWYNEPKPGVSYVGTVNTIANFTNQGLNGIAYDPDDGLFYILLYWDLYRIESNGQTTHIANFNSYGFPNTIVWDAHTHLFYVSCSQNYQVVSVNSTGTIALLAGGTHGTNDGTGSSAQFQFPSGMALDPTRHLLYVVDNDRMRTITEKGKVVTVGPTGVLNPNYFGQSYSLAFDTHAGVVAITDVASDSIISFDPATSTYQTIDGRCILLNNQNGCTPLYADGPGATALFSNPQGIVYDPTSDAFYVADQGNYMVRRVSANGTALRIAGSGYSVQADGVYLAASFLGPTCATLDPTTGNVVVCDGGFMRSVTTAGQTPPPPKHQFAMRMLSSIVSGPTGMVETPDGSLWFAERSSGAIGRVLPTRVVHEYGLPGGYAQPYDPALASDGNVIFGNFSAFNQYFPTQGNIGEITAGGKVSELAFPNRCSVNAPSYPTLMSTSPSGDLWFAGVCPNSIGYETPQHTFTEYVSSALGGLTASAGSVIWAGDQYGLYEYSTTGALLRTYPVAADGGVIVAANGDIWTLASSNQSVSDVTPSNGNTVTYQLPGCGSFCSRTLGNPIWGRDGALWFTESGGQYLTFAGAIGRITTTGHFTEFPTYEPRSQPSGVAFDAGGSTWLADFGANKIGKMR
jgi:sugar lactone lactonase YvrE